MMRVYDRHTSSSILNLVSHIGVNNLVTALIESGYTIPDDAVIDFFACGELNLNELCKHQVPPYKLMLKHPDLLDWASISKYAGQWVSSNDVKYFDFVLLHLGIGQNVVGRIDAELAIQNICKKSMSVNMGMLYNLIESTDRSRDVDIFETISTFDGLDSTFIRRYETRLDWYRLTSRSHVALSSIPEDLIVSHMRECNWLNLWLYNNFSVQFIRDMIEMDPNETYIRWNFISLQNNIDEAFIEEFKDSLAWDLISEYQDLSLEFLIQHRELIVISSFLRNSIIDKNVKQQFIDMYQLEDGSDNHDDRL